MRTLGTLLPALVAGVLVLPALPVSAAADPERVTVRPADAPVVQLGAAWVDVPEDAIVQGDSRTPITGIKGKVRQIASYADGWVARAHGLYTVDSSGAATQIMRRRPTDGFALDDQGMVAIQTEGPGERERATVFDISTGELVDRYLGHRVEVLDYHDGRVWMAVRDTRADRSQLVIWDPETGSVQPRPRFGLDGLDAEHEIAWRMKRQRISVFALSPEQGWRWSARHYPFINPALSPDGRHVVTYTRRGEEPDYPYAGSMVVRDTGTGDARVDFRGLPTGEPFWVSNRRFVSAYFKGGDALRTAQMMLALDGDQRRVSPFGGGHVQRVLVGAPQPILRP